MHDLIEKIMTDLILRGIIWLITRFAGSDFTANVTHAIEERLVERGPLAATWSALKAVFRVRDVRDEPEADSDKVPLQVAYARGGELHIGHLITRHGERILVEAKDFSVGTMRHSQEILDQPDVYMRHITTMEFWK